MYDSKTSPTRESFTTAVHKSFRCCACSKSLDPDSSDSYRSMLVGCHNKDGQPICYVTCVTAVCKRHADVSLATHLAYDLRLLPVKHYLVHEAKQLQSLQFLRYSSALDSVTDGWSIQAVGWSKSRAVGILHLQRTIDATTEHRGDSTVADFIKLNAARLRASGLELTPMSYPKYFPADVKTLIDSVIEQWNRAVVG